MVNPGASHEIGLPPGHKGSRLGGFTLDNILRRNLPEQGAEPGRVALVFRDREHTFETIAVKRQPKQ